MNTSNHSQKLALFRRSAILLAVLSVLPACTDFEEGDFAHSEAHSSFEVTPVISIEGTGYGTAIRVDSVFLGVGSVILERVDGPGASILSNRAPAGLSFQLDSLDADLSREVAPIRVDEPGTYLVTLAVEPQVPEEEPVDEETTIMTAFSVNLEGRYYVVRPGGEDPVLSPEPVPWTPPYQKSLRSDMIQRGNVEVAPFHYESARTGYIRLGEVELRPEQNRLVVRIDLQGWIDSALEPVLEDIFSASSTAPVLDLSANLESAGLGLEKLFMLSETEAL